MNQEIKNLLATIAVKKDLLAACKETSESIQAQQAIITEAQEQIKALLLADEDAVSMTEELKSLNGELKDALKYESKALQLKDVMVKPVELKKYYVALSKDKVQDTVQLGSKFVVLTNNL